MSFRNSISKPLSIVVPSYNSARYLPDALESIFGQACADDCEIIVVDGGSTDGTLDVIRRFEPRLAWWCSESDSGQSEALNKGFAHANGDYFTWLNADDILLPGAIASVLEHIGQTGSQWISANQIYIDGCNRILRCTRGNRWSDFLYCKDVPQVYGPSSFFTRELFVRAGGFDESLRYCMDRYLWIKFRELGAKFDKLNRYCWGFRVHDDSKTQSKVRDDAELGRQREEIVSMYARKNVPLYGRSFYFSRILRLCDGTYFYGALDTWRWRGEDIHRINPGDL